MKITKKLLIVLITIKNIKTMGGMGAAIGGGYKTGSKTKTKTERDPNDYEEGYDCCRWYHPGDEETKNYKNWKVEQYVWFQIGVGSSCNGKIYDGNELESDPAIKKKSVCERVAKDNDERVERMKTNLKQDEIVYNNSYQKVLDDFGKKLFGSGNDNKIII